MISRITLPNNTDSRILDTQLDCRAYQSNALSSEAERIPLKFGNREDYYFSRENGFLSREIGYNYEGSYSVDELKDFSNKRGLFVGIGSVGGQIFQNCILLGGSTGEEGVYTIIDGGVGEISNIPRQMTTAFHARNNWPKVMSAIDFSNQQSPYSKVNGYMSNITSSQLESLILPYSFDFIVMGADASSPLTNYTLLRLAEKYSIPVFGGLDLNEIGISLNMLPGVPSSMRTAINSIDEAALKDGQIHPFAFLVKMIDPKHIPLGMLINVMEIISGENKPQVINQSLDSALWQGRIGARSIVKSFSQNELVLPYRIHDIRFTGADESYFPEIVTARKKIEDRRTEWIKANSQTRYGMLLLNILGTTIEDLIEGRNPIEA